MSYFRNIRADELAQWLVEVWNEEPEDAMDLAIALTDRFDILFTSSTPQ